MIATDVVFKHSEEDRLSMDGTETPVVISDKMTTNKDSISGLLALGMLGIAVAIIILSLWSQKHKRKPMLMQCGPNVKSYHTMCAIPTRIHLPQFIEQPKKSIKNPTQLMRSDKALPLVHDKRKITQKIFISQQRHNRIVTVSELWKEKSRQSNNYFLINVIPEEEVS